MSKVKLLKPTEQSKHTSSTRIRLRGENLLAALACDKLNQDAVESLWLAAQFWLADGGRIPMNRFLGLPTTRAQLNRASRDMWLRKAAKMTQGESQFLKASALHRELNTFTTRGAWLTWRHLQIPPDEASDLRRALFFVVKFSDGKVISERQIYTVIR